MSSRQMGSFFPILTPRTPMLLNPIKPVPEELNSGMIDEKMDSMLSHLKQEIKSNTGAASFHNTPRGGAHLTIETEDSASVPHGQQKIENDGLNLNIDLINDSFHEAERR